MQNAGLSRLRSSIGRRANDRNSQLAGRDEIPKASRFRRRQTLLASLSLGFRLLLYFVAPQEDTPGSPGSPAHSAGFTSDKNEER